MAKTSKTSGIEEISVHEIEKGVVEVNILGLTPLVMNSMSEKARQSLLFPMKKTAADRNTSLKHDPMSEYRNSVYANIDEHQPTRPMFPAAAFKRAMANAALDIPGLKKAQIGRLVWVNDQSVNVYGVPQMIMAVVRTADMNHTPDIRTRAILPKWGARISVSYVKPNLSATQISKLLGVAGMLIGIGDGRQEKGALNFGQFEIVSDNDPRWVALQKNAGRKPQDAALADPAYHDLETQKLYTWFVEEFARRGADPDRKASATRKKSKGEADTDLTDKILAKRYGRKKGNGASVESVE